MQPSFPEDPITAEITSLQKPLRGRRWLSWLLFISLLLLCLIVPVLATLAPTWTATPAVKDGTPSLSTKSTFHQLDNTWNPGAMSNSHQPWAKDCKACHSTPFVRVQDTDCLACHKGIGDHVDRKIVVVGALHDMRCASCHREHQGDFGLVEQNKRYTADQCASCHADIKKSFPNTSTHDVTDFANAHPEFRVQLASGSDKPVLTRTRLSTTSPLNENTHLKFPHDVHLFKSGVNSPAGRIKMICNDCHKPNADQTSFRPVTMKEHCQSCHALKFEPAVSNREVPHGSVDDVLSTLREFYSYVGVQGVPLSVANSPVFQLRPGKQMTMASFVKSSGDARQQAAAAATQLFEKTSCIVCHDVTRLPGTGRVATSGQDLPQWRIAPVAPKHVWMPKAEFSHAKHTTAECVDCHNAPTSKKATDVLMPAIQACRECHVGNQPKRNKITSDCGLCHGFHSPAHGSSGSAASPNQTIHTPPEGTR